MNNNQDNYCNSSSGTQMRQQLLSREAPLTKSADYSRVGKYDQSDTRPMWMKTTGVVDPVSYTFTPQNRWYVWCGKQTSL